MLRSELLNHLLGFLGRFDHDGRCGRRSTLVIAFVISSTREFRLDGLMEQALSLVVCSHICWLDLKRVLAVRVRPSGALLLPVVDIYSVGVLSPSRGGVTDQPSIKVVDRDCF